MVIYYQAHPTFWLTDVKPQPVWPLQNVNNLTLCSRPRDWISPMIQQLNWSRHLLSDWWHSQNRSACLHQPDYASVRVSVFLCFCVSVEVIISGGWRDLLVPVVVLHGAVLGRDSLLVYLTHTPLMRSPEPTSSVIPSLTSLSHPPVSLWTGATLISPSLAPGENTGSEGKSWKCM